MADNTKNDERKGDKDKNKDKGKDDKQAGAKKDEHKRDKK